jgi:hypothetical protein
MVDRQLGIIRLIAIFLRLVEGETEGDSKSKETNLDKLKLESVQ